MRIMVMLLEETKKKRIEVKCLVYDFFFKLLHGWNFGA